MWLTGHWKPIICLYLLHTLHLPPPPPPTVPLPFSLPQTHCSVWCVHVQVVPPNQAELMYKAVLEKGIPTMLVMFEGKKKPSSLPLSGVGGRGGGCWHELGVTCRRTERDICTCNHLTQLPCTEYTLSFRDLCSVNKVTQSQQKTEATEGWDGIQYWTENDWSQRG